MTKHAKTEKIYKKQKLGKIFKMQFYQKVANINI